MLTTDRPTIPIAKPELGEEEAAAARDAILSGWVTQGPRVAAFEEAFAATVQASHACAVSNCTTALHLALHALGVKAGDEVVTVSHSFIATANAIRYCGATPVFVDIERDYFTIDPSKIESALTPRTRTIDDLPHPDGPTTTCTAGSADAAGDRNSAASCSTSWRRPKSA